MRRGVDAELDPSSAAAGDLDQGDAEDALGRVIDLGLREGRLDRREAGAAGTRPRGAATATAAAARQTAAASQHRRRTPVNALTRATVLARARPRPRALAERRVTVSVVGVARGSGLGCRGGRVLLSGA